MIRINLLPVREARRKAEVREQIVVLAATVIGCLMLAAGVHMVVLGQTAAARQRVGALKQQLAQYKPQQEQVEAFKAKKAEIEQKLAVIDQLERSRSGPVHILDELASHIPERVWLTDLSAQNGRIELEGMSLDNELVALFLTALNESPYFTAVELKATELKTVDSLKLNTFRIVAQLDSPDAPAAADAPAAGNPPAAPARAAAAKRS